MTDGGMDATIALDAPRAEQPRAAQPNGWWGMVLLIATEATLFGCLFGSYFYLRIKNVHWPPPGIDTPDPVVPLVLVGVLVLTSVPMQLASFAAVRGRRGRAWLAIALALVVQSGYFAFEIHSFLRDLHAFTPAQHAYGSIYFTLLGADHFHVAVGLLLNLWLLARLLTRLTRYRRTAVRTVALYWHFVNVLTLLVTGAILSPSL